MVAEVGEGFAALFGHRVLRAVVVTAALVLFAVSAQQAIFILFLVRELDLSPALVGVALATQSVGAVVGAMGAAPLARRIGIGPSIVAGTFFALAAVVARAASAGDLAAALPLLVAGQLTLGVTWSIFNVNGPSLRQALTPHHLLGRVNASYRFSAWGITPLGALAGGLLAEAFGIRAAMVAAGAWMILPAVFAAFSPLRALRRATPAEPAPAAT